MWGNFSKNFKELGKEKFAENTNFLVKKWANILKKGCIFIKLVLSMGEPQYKVLKERVIEKVKRVKLG